MCVTRRRLSRSRHCLALAAESPLVQAPPVPNAQRAPRSSNSPRARRRKLKGTRHAHFIIDICSLWFPKVGSEGWGACTLMPQGVPVLNKAPTLQQIDALLTDMSDSKSFHLIQKDPTLLSMECPLPPMFLMGALCL